MMPRRDQLDRLLWDHVTQARWFSGKGRIAQLASVNVLADVTSPAPAGDTAAASYPGCVVRVMVVEVAYGDHGQDEEADIEYYQVPVSLYPEAEFDRRLAGASPTEAQALVGALGRVPGHLVGLPDVAEVMVCDASADALACSLILQRLLSTPPPSPCSKDQHRFEPLTVWMLDREGLSNDLVPQRFGGEQSNTSILYGDVALLKVFRRLELGRNLDIDVHHVLGRAGVPDAAHLFGWIEGRWTTASGARVHADLAMLVERLADAQDGYELARSRCAAQQDFSAQARELGRALRHVHDALAQHFEAGTVSGAGRARGMRRRLSRATAIAPDLERYADGLQAIFDTIEDVRVPVQRIHGDFHLGQALLTPGGWKIIDFEGEPLKALAERAEPDTPLRDVAGLMRSLAYAAGHAAEPEGQQWVDTCRAAFLDGWLIEPLGPDEQALLRAYEADKAVYEVVYETRNRPEWVGIPLAAIQALTRIHPPFDRHRPSRRGPRPPTATR